MNWNKHFTFGSNNPPRLSTSSYIFILRFEPSTKGSLKSYLHGKKVPRDELRWNTLSLLALSLFNLNTLILCFVSIAKSTTFKKGLFTVFSSCYIRTNYLLFEVQSYRAKSFSQIPSDRKVEITKCIPVWHVFEKRILTNSGNTAAQFDETGGRGRVMLVARDIQTTSIDPIQNE